MAGSILQEKDIDNELDYSDDASGNSNSDSDISDSCVRKKVLTHKRSKRKPTEKCLNKRRLSLVVDSRRVSGKVYNEKSPHKSLTNLGCADQTNKIITKRGKSEINRNKSSKVETNSVTQTSSNEIVDGKFWNSPINRNDSKGNSVNQLKNNNYFSNKTLSSTSKSKSYSNNVLDKFKVKESHGGKIQTNLKLLRQSVWCDLFGQGSKSEDTKENRSKTFVSDKFSSRSRSGDSSTNLLENNLNQHIAKPDRKPNLSQSSDSVDSASHTLAEVRKRILNDIFPQTTEDFVNPIINDDEVDSTEIHDLKKLKKLLNTCEDKVKIDKKKNNVRCALSKSIKCDNEMQRNDASNVCEKTNKEDDCFSFESDKNTVCSKAQQRKENMRLVKRRKIYEVSELEEESLKSFVSKDTRKRDGRSFSLVSGKDIGFYQTKTYENKIKSVWSEKKYVIPKIEETKLNSLPPFKKSFNVNPIFASKNNIYLARRNNYILTSSVSEDSNNDSLSDKCKTKNVSTVIKLNKKNNILTSSDSEDSNSGRLFPKSKRNVNTAIKLSKKNNTLKSSGSEDSSFDSLSDKRKRIANNATKLSKKNILTSSDSEDSNNDSLSDKRKTKNVSTATELSKKENILSSSGSEDSSFDSLSVKRKRIANNATKLSKNNILTSSDSEDSNNESLSDKRKTKNVSTATELSKKENIVTSSDSEDSNNDSLSDKRKTKNVSTATELSKKENILTSSGSEDTSFDSLSVKRIRIAHNATKLSKENILTSSDSEDSNNDSLFDKRTTKNVSTATELSKKENTVTSSDSEDSNNDSLSDKHKTKNVSTATELSKKENILTSSGSEDSSFDSLSVKRKRIANNATKLSKNNILTSSDSEDSNNESLSDKRTTKNVSTATELSKKENIVTSSDSEDSNNGLLSDKCKRNVNTATKLSKKNILTSNDSEDSNNESLSDKRKTKNVSTATELSKKENIVTSSDSEDSNNDTLSDKRKTKNVSTATELSKKENILTSSGSEDSSFDSLSVKRIRIANNAAKLSKKNILTSSDSEDSNNDSLSDKGKTKNVSTATELSIKENIVTSSDSEDSNNGLLSDKCKRNVNTATKLSKKNILTSNDSEDSYSHTLAEIRTNILNNIFPQPTEGFFNLKNNVDEVDSTGSDNLEKHRKTISLNTFEDKAKVDKMKQSLICSLSKSIKCGNYLQRNSVSNVCRKTKEEDDSFLFESDKNIICLKAQKKEAKIGSVMSGKKYEISEFEEESLQSIEKQTFKIEETKCNSISPLKKSSIAKVVLENKNKSYYVSRKKNIHKGSGYLDSNDDSLADKPKMNASSFLSQKFRESNLFEVHDEQANSFISRNKELEKNNGISNLTPGELQGNICPKLSRKMKKEEDSFSLESDFLKTQIEEQKNSLFDKETNTIPSLTGRNRNTQHKECSQSNKRKAESSDQEVKPSKIPCKSPFKSIDLRSQTSATKSSPLQNSWENPATPGKFCESVGKTHPKCYRNSKGLSAKKNLFSSYHTTDLPNLVEIPLRRSNTNKGELREVNNQNSDESQETYTSNNIITLHKRERNEANKGKNSLVSFERLDKTPQKTQTRDQDYNESEISFEEENKTPLKLRHSSLHALGSAQDRKKTEHFTNSPSDSSVNNSPSCHKTRVSINTKNTPSKVDRALKQLNIDMVDQSTKSPVRQVKIKSGMTFLNLRKKTPTILETEESSPDTDSYSAMSSDEPTTPTSKGSQKDILTMEQISLSKDVSRVLLSPKKGETSVMNISSCNLNINKMKGQNKTDVSDNFDSETSDSTVNEPLISNKIKITTPIKKVPSRTDSTLKSLDMADETLKSPERRVKRKSRSMSLSVQRASDKLDESEELRSDKSDPYSCFAMISKETISSPSNGCQNQACTEEKSGKSNYKISKTESNRLKIDMNESFTKSPTNNSEVISPIYQRTTRLKSTPKTSLKQSGSDSANKLKTGCLIEKDRVHHSPLKTHLTPSKKENSILSDNCYSPRSSLKYSKISNHTDHVSSPLQKQFASVTTPVSKKSTGRGFLTPSMARKEREQMGKIEDDLDTTRRQLHISTIPKSLPCRDAEFSQIKSFLLRKIEHSTGGCMYISGVPGTGKTATVHAVIRSLQEEADKGEVPEFDFVEVNGLRLTEPKQAYVRIYQALTDNKLAPDQAQQLLNKRFSTSCKRSTIILVDELDYLCNRRQDVVYNILDWPSKNSSRLVVLAISNTMDLPERTLKGRVTSRMGLTRMAFQPYSHHQLREIVCDRLSGTATFHPDAVQLVARKVAAVSGDARRALDICRRTTELVVNKGGGQVTASHVEQALTQIFSGPRVLVIQSLGQLSQLVLRALRDVNERTGVDETTAGQVYQHLEQICALEGCQLPPVGSVLQTCVGLVGLGLVVAEKGRLDVRRKMTLNVSSDDIHYALESVKSH